MLIEWLHDTGLHGDVEMKAYEPQAKYQILAGVVLNTTNGLQSTVIT